MILNDLVINTIFNILKNKSLSNLTPVKIKFFSGSTDKTVDLFGFSSYTVTTDKWNAASNKQIQNGTNLVVGTLLQNFSGDLTLKFYTNANDELLSYTYTTSITSGSVYTILSNSLKFTLPNLTTNLANFLLDYLFRNVTSGKPTGWYLEFQRSDSSAYQTRIQLDCDKFSEPYTDETGYKCVSYGKYIFTVTNSTEQLKYGRLFTASSGGNSWFDTIELLPHDVYSGRVIELFNNNLVITIPPQTLDGTFLLPKDTTCLLYVDFDGRSTNTVTDQVPVVDTLSYNPSLKLFKAECASMLASEVVEYTDINLTNPCTIQFFVCFSSDPSGREITFLEKSGSFKVYQTASNQLCIDNQAGVLLSTTWTPTTGVWYHVFISKNGTELRLRVNNDVNQYTTVSADSIFDTNASHLKVNDTYKPILGFCNGVYIHSAAIAFTLLTQPLPSRAYDWKYINSHVWKDMTTQQWFEYCRTT